MSSGATLEQALSGLSPLVDRYVTRDRVRRYMMALASTPAPSTAATAMRLPVLKKLLEDDGAFLDGKFRLEGGLRRCRQPCHLDRQFEQREAALVFRPS
jgi:hypothetical protein